MKKQSQENKVSQFWDLVDITESCWRWRGRTNIFGYGVFFNGGKQVIAHRAVLNVIKGETPRNVKFRHSCGNVSCLNPDHLIRITKKIKERKGIDHVALFWQKVEKGEGCWEWQGCLSRGTGGGYGSVTINRRTIPAHRASWAMANGSIPENLWVLHRCGNKKCVRPDHLYLGTIFENARDAIVLGELRSPHGDRHGTHTQPHRVARGERHSSKTHPEKVCRGEKHGGSKLTWVAVRDIRKRVANKETTRKLLAFQYGITRTVIDRIVNNVLWKE